METEQHTEILTYQIVIFGATGDLCHRKLIPALYKLHQKKLLPENLKIVGTSRREISLDDWIWKLGDYPEDFKSRLCWVSTDLENQKIMKNYQMQTTQLISYLSHQKDMSGQS